MKFVFIPIFFYSLLAADNMLAQSPADSTRSVSIRQMIIGGEKALGENSILFSGREYTGYDRQFKGEPYFISDSMNAGSVWYNGLCFRDIPMLYDILNDNLIILSFLKDTRICLASERTDSFRLLGHSFIRILTDSSQPQPIPSGFYDEIYPGKTAVLIRRWKTGIMPIDPGQPPRYIQRTAWFIKKKDLYYPVHSKKEFFALLADKRKQVLKYLRSQNLKYRKDPELTMSRAAEYYDLLN